MLLLTIFVALSVPHVAAQVLNMSHDLVPLGIAAHNLLPNAPSQDARPLIQAAVQYVQNHPVQVLTLDKGNYYLLTAQQSSATLVFGRLSNMIVDLAGSTIYFNGPLLPNGVEVFQCTDFTLKNFQTDFLNPPYTHVQLTSVDPAQRLLRYQTLQGWPDPSTFNNLTLPSGGAIEGLWAAIFRNGAIVPGTTRTLLTRPVAGNTLGLAQDGTPWTQSATLSMLLPGDTVVVAARGGGPPILVWESDTVTLSNITVFGSPTWAVQLYATRNSTVDGVRVMPRPGSGLVGSNADGIHFASVRQNNHLRNSYITRTLDDALIMDNLHAALVVNKTGPRQLTVTRNIYLRFPNGTAVNFVDPATTMEIAGATIVSQTPPDSDSPIFDAQVDLLFDRDLPPLAAGAAMVYGTPAMRGQGSTIEDNLVEDTYGGRGVWVSGAQGVTVQRNVIRRTSLAGIIVASSTDPIDPRDFGPPARDITIRNNSLVGVLGPAANGTGAQVALASIQVVSTNNQQVGFATGASNSNISIVNNSIADSGRSAIWVGELNGGTIENNLIGTYNQHPELPVWGLSGSPQFISQLVNDFASPIVIRYSSGVTSQNNRSLPAIPNYQGLWWAPGGAESGWGINFAHQGDVIFATWFTYDANGKAWWLTMTANKTAEGVYSGILYKTNGAPFSAFVPPATPTQVGTGTLTFTGATSGTFAYVVNGIAQTKAIVPQLFGPLTTCVWGAQPDLTKATNFQDLWWATGGTESGWGVNLTQQGTTIFATWFTYDANRNPLWLSATVPQTAPNTFSGTLYLTNGPAFSAVPFDPTKVMLTLAGTATFAFTDGNTGTFSYNVDLGDGVNKATQTKSITRQVFRAPGTVCQ